MISFKRYLREILDPKTVKGVFVSYRGAGTTVYNGITNYERHLHGDGPKLEKIQKSREKQGLPARVHYYSYPTDEDMKRLQSEHQSHIQNGNHEEAAKLQDQIKNIHIHPQLHGGRIVIREYHGQPTDISFTEGHNPPWTEGSGSQMIFPRDTRVPGKLNLEPGEGATKRASYTFKHVVAAMKHFKNLPVMKPNPDNAEETQDVVTYDWQSPEHRITPSVDGKHTWSFLTPDATRHKLYTKVFASMGDEGINFHPDFGEREFTPNQPTVGKYK